MHIFFFLPLLLGFFPLFLGNPFHNQKTGLAAQPGVCHINRVVLISKPLPCIYLAQDMLIFHFGVTNNYLLLCLISRENV